MQLSFVFLPLCKFSALFSFTLDPFVGHLDAMLRSLMVSLMGKCGCKDTIAEACNRFNHHVRNLLESQVSWIGFNISIISTAFWKVYYQCWSTCSRLWCCTCSRRDRRIEPNDRGSFYISVPFFTLFGNMNEFQLHNTSDLHEEKERIERCLGKVTDQKLLEKVLEFAMSVSP